MKKILIMLALVVSMAIASAADVTPPDVLAKVGANTVLAGPASGANAVGSWRALVLGDVAASVLGTGTANSTTFLRGDRTWQTVTTTPADGSITNAMVSGTAAIAGTKIAPDFGAQVVATSVGVTVNDGLGNDVTLTPTSLNLTDATNSASITPTAVNVKKVVLTETVEPALSNAGEAVLYADSTAHVLKVSNNGGAFANLGGVADGSISTAKLADDAVTAAKVDATTVPTLAAANAFTNNNTFTSDDATGAIKVVGRGVSNLHKLTQWFASDGTTEKAFVREDGFFAADLIGTTDSLTAALVQDAAYVSLGLQLRNTAMTTWSSNGTWYGTKDVGIARSSAGIVEINNGTAGGGGALQLNDISSIPTPGSGKGFFYSKDTAGTSQLWAMGESVTNMITAHPMNAPAAMYDMEPGVEKFDFSIHKYRGEVTWVNQTRMARKLDGEALGKCYMVETFAQYNARTGENLVKEDWDANQQAQKAERAVQIAEQKARKAAVEKEAADFDKLPAKERKGKAKPEFKEPELKPHVKKPKPAFAK